MTSQNNDNGDLRLGLRGDISNIRKGLFVGNAHAAGNLSFLKANGITHVINCTPTPSAASSAWSKDRYLQLNLEDKPKSASQYTEPETPLSTAVLDRATGFIRRAKCCKDGCVLVHCAYGKSRSVAGCCSCSLPDGGGPFSKAT
mmetsp:Transcript_21464/g.36856  ORF Transcript_21464/g.36856 Transcript_21464/m.36856 type:complete len:144 (-) Transcript_21464:1024-1455(-)